MSQFWPPLPSGVVTQRGIASVAATGLTVVTFPRPFAGTPVVVVSAARLTVDRAVAMMVAPGPTGFQVDVWRVDPAPIAQVAGSVHWEATGVLA